MSLDPRRIGYFIAVFEEGSISRAADRENIAQPALSVQIRNLETDLAVRLFERSAQGVRPTAAGRRFYDLCLDLRRRERSARQQMLDFGGTVAGNIGFGVMPSICRGPLAAILADFSRTYPEVDIRVMEANSGTLAEAVAAGEIDFAICNQPASQSGLNLAPIYTDRIMLTSGYARNLAPWRPCDLADVVDLKLVLPSYRHALRRTLDTHLKTGAIRAARVMEIDGLVATLQLVEASDWSTLLPSVAFMTGPNTQRLIVNPVAEPRIVSEIYQINAPDRPLSLPAERMVRMVRDMLAMVPERLARLAKS